MKKVLIICGLLFSVITFAQAQQGGGRKMLSPEERATKNTENLSKKLNLTEDQKTKVKAIFLDQAASVDKLRDEAKDGDRGAMRDKMKAANDQNDAKINEVLNDVQKKSYAAWKEERKQNMQKRPEGKGPKGENAQ